MSRELDVVVIGAGAAGIAAAHALAASKLSFIVIESLGRLGGRGCTVHCDGMQMDAGCAWLHSARMNVWTRIAERNGFTIDLTPPGWDQQARHCGVLQADQGEARAALAQFKQRLREFPPGSDCAADALDPGCPWNEYINAVSGFVSGSDLTRISAKDLLSYENSSSDDDWRVVEGYGALITMSGAGLPIALSTAVTKVDHSSMLLRVETSKGAIRARAAIVTASTSALCSGALDFYPPLPDKVHDASKLPLGLAEKVFLRAEGFDEIGSDTHLVGSLHTRATGSYFFKPFGRPIIECFFGGETAGLLRGKDSECLVDLAYRELAAIFGSNIRSRLHPQHCTNWLNQPEIGGSYSYAVPSHAEARRRLSEPVEGRIFFAGEACSTDQFSTAHGAYESGRAAADTLIRHLERGGQ